MKDFIYCSDFEDCQAKLNCQRADAPKDNSITTDYFFELYDSSKGCCPYFLCNCYKAVFVGSSRHGNYYKCLVCGEEWEG